jgi:cell division protein FtsI/penicillin-binding protein 2
MQKSKVMKQRKAQVTLFVIIAAVLALGLILFFSLKPALKPSVSVTEPQAYIEKCMKDAVSEALDLVSKQGGSLDPTGYVLYQDSKINYICYTSQYYMKCVNQQPMLKYHVENEVTDYVYPKLQECISTLKRELTAQGYEVSTGSLNLVTRLEPKKVVIEAAVPITIRKEETKKFDRFKASLLSPIYDQVILAQDIVNSEIEYGDYDQLSYMLYRPEVDIEKKPQGENTIYILKDRGTEKRFLFAVRSYVMPPGF